MPDLVKRQDFVAAEQITRQPPLAWSPEMAGGGRDLRRYYHVVWKRKWLILATLVSIMVVVTIETLSTTPLYKSSAKVQIDPEPSKVLPYQGIAESSVPFYDDYYLQTKYQSFQSRSLIRRVVKRLNLANDPMFNFSPSSGFFSERLPSLTGWIPRVFSMGRPKSESAPRQAQKEEDPEAPLIDQFLGNLQMQIMKNSWLIEISYTSHDPQFAAKCVNTLTDEVIEQNFDMKFDATMAASKFLQKQLDELKIKVEKSEQDLVNYGRASNIVNLSERQNIVLQKLADLNQEMTRIQSQLISQTARYDSIKNATVDNFPTSLKDGLIAGLETRLSALGQSLATLSSRFGDDWPEVIQVNKEIAEVKGQISQEREEAIAQARLDYGIALDHNKKLSAALENQKYLANQLREESIQYNILQREVDINKQLYEGLLQRLKQAGVSAGLKSSNIQVVDGAEVPRSPYRPQTQLNLTMGLLFGLISGLGLAFLIESLENTVKTPEMVEQYLGLPSLGVIPAIGQFLTRLDRKELSDGRGGLKTSPVLLYGYLKSRSQVWEAYRSLRTSILLSHSDKRPQKILITSALVGEGKTTTAVNTAIVLAQTGARTLIMDLDMRRPSVGRIFRLVPDGGMSNFLSGNSDLASQIRITAFPNLYILPAGMPPPNPAELIGSRRMKDALTLLGQYFEYIIIDTPPILSVTDPLALSPQVDGVILVIHGGKTGKDAVKKATTSLTAVGGKILGAIVNNVNIKDSEYSHYYRYYYHDHYYHAKEESTPGRNVA